MTKKLKYLILCICLALLCSCPVLALGEETPVQVSADFGIYHSVKSGRYVPVHIRAEKNGDFETGTVRLSVPVSYQESYIYEKKLTFQNRYIEEVIFYVPIFYNTRKLQIEVLDQEGEPVYSSVETLNIQNDYGEIFTGILDRLENDESRLNHLIIEDNFDLSIREINISTDSFPEHVLDLNLIDVMIVNPSAEKILTAEKRKVLWQWIEQGGVCIMNESSQEDWKIYGNGCCYYYSGDLFSQDEEEIRKIFRSVMGSERLDHISSSALMGSGYDYWDAASLINASDAKNEPPLYPYAVLLVLYMFAVCPLIFLYLRKKRKSIYYGYHVLFCAGLFTVLIYVAGGRTRIYGPVVQYCRVLELQGDWIREDNFIGVKSPDNKENEIAVDSSYAILPIQSGLDSYYLDGEQYDFQDYILKIESREDCSAIKIRNKEAFETSMFLMKRTEKNSGHSMLKASLHIFNDKIEGEVENQTGYNLTDVFVAGYGHFYYIGDLENGEKAEIKDQEMEHYTPEYFSTVSGALREENRGSGEYFISSVFGKPTEQFMAAGFVRTEPSFLESEVYETDGLTIVSQECETAFTEGNQVYYPVLERRPTVISGTFRYESWMMESESCVIQYSLGSDLLIDSVAFHVNPCTSGENTLYRHVFDGSAWFMNWESGQYEEAGSLEGIMTAEQLAPYLNENNQLQIKYEDTDYGNNIYSIGLPFITVTGREKDAGY